jgi:hypothetical protein
MGEALPDCRLVPQAVSTMGKAHAPTCDLDLRGLRVAQRRDLGCRAAPAFTTRALPP